MRVTQTVGIIVGAEHGALGDKSIQNSAAVNSALRVSPIIRVRRAGSTR
jgi:hypothetical protein